jgi:Asp-tRNA(Asn)/Glu-tRNA(Gln) amidotransferase C subunit
MSSVSQLGGFGKNEKTGAYEGSCIHDDISVTVLFVSRVNDIDEFIERLEEWAEDNSGDITAYMSDFLHIVRESENEDELSDGDFADLYGMSGGGTYNMPGITVNPYSAGGGQLTYSQIMSGGNLNKR